MKITLLETDEEFAELLPLIKQFSIKADVPFWQQVNEVSGAFTNQNWLTIVAGDDGPIAYLCGYYLSKSEFMVSQLYSKNPDVTKAILLHLETYLKSVKVEKIIALFKHHPRTAERHGYRVERYVMTKSLVEGS